MRTFLFTPAFCKAKLLEDCLKHFYMEKKRDPFYAAMRHVVIDNHYPVNKERNRDWIKIYCEQYNCLYVDSGKDLGLHEGLNHAMKEVGITREDYMLVCDPDDRPAPGSLKALKQVMKADPKIAVAACVGYDYYHSVRRNSKPDLIAEHQVFIHNTVEMWNVAAYHVGFIKDIGGFKEIFAYYGGIEAALYDQWKDLGMKLAYLKNFNCDWTPVNKHDPELFDVDYRNWKTAHTSREFDGSFEEFLTRNHSQNSG